MSHKGVSGVTLAGGEAPSRILGPSAIQGRSGPRDVLILAAWCGLAAGWLEVATRFVCRYINPTNRLHQRSRHFVWAAPLTYLLLFLAMGLFLAVVTRLWPRRGGWLSRRLIVACAFVPALMVAGPQIYNEAWIILATGMASRLVPVLERHAIGWRRGLSWSLPGLLAMVPVVAGSLVAGDWIKERREAGRPRPLAGSPNVLLIVMDTVRADHLSLYGYHRATTPRLEQLAKRGIRFEKVRATAPWTLPSHASLFTGRWPHELGVEWMTPLRGGFPTLAEYLGSHGYATAGFAANTLFCSYDTGIDRGFAHYEDYQLGVTTALRTALVVDLAFQAAFAPAAAHGPSLAAGPWRPLVEPLLGLVLDRDRVGAQATNRRFLDWLSRRREPGRPYFAFLNYFDAHTPYIPPAVAGHRFGLRPRNLDEARVLDDWGELDKVALPPYFQFLARDSYDNCLAYLDQQLGELFDELERRGELDRTLMIVTSDHGEGLGEHDLFDHGESLYRTEIDVPLLIVEPASRRSRGVVGEVVSLRSLPATIAELVGLGAGSPFPGPSLAGLWRGSPPVDGPVSEDLVISELKAPNPSHPNQGRSPAERGPLIALAEGDFVYIRNEGDGAEELFNERDDPRESLNRAGVEAMQPVLNRLRGRVDRWKKGP